MFIIFPHAMISVDAPSNPKGAWFLDINLGRHLVVVQWKADQGFGITTNPGHDGYGEGACETFQDAERAYNRMTALLLG